MVDGYVEKTYRVYSGMLLCGNLSSKVQLYPPPSNAIRYLILHIASQCGLSLNKTDMQW